MNETVTMQTEEREAAPADHQHVAFVPERLGGAGRRLEHFAVSVLFVSSVIRDGARTTSEAVYEPDLGTFRQEDGIGSMIYRNTCGDTDLLVMAHDSNTGNYHGTKIIGGDLVGKTAGSGWNEFFANLVALGVVAGESCRVIEVDRPWNQLARPTNACAEGARNGVATEIRHGG